MIDGARSVPGAPGPMDAATFHRILAEDAVRTHGCRVLDVRSSAVSPKDHVPGTAWIPDTERLPAFLLPPRGRPLVAWGPSSRARAGRLTAAGWPTSWFEGSVPSGLLVPGRPTGSLWNVDRLLEKHLVRLPGPEAGPVLDVGSGSSREGIFLAQHGYRVVLVDRLPDALDLARARAASCGEDVASRVSVETLRIRRGADLPDGPFSVVLNFRFLERRVLECVASRLVPGGWLLFRAYGRPRTEGGFVGRGPRRTQERTDPDEVGRALGSGWRWVDPPRLVQEDDAIWVLAAGSHGD